MNLARKHLSTLSLILGAWLLSVAAVHGQSGARLKGTVLDASGGRVTGADVTLFSDDRVLTTKANQFGIFEFAPLPANIRFIEASSPGFASVSIALADQTPEDVSFTLSPGQGGGVTPTPLCSPPRNMPMSSPSYEEKHGDAQLTGGVNEPSGAPLAGTFLTLLKVDLDASLDGPHRGLSIRALYSKQRVVAEIASNEKGEFQFADLQPGWYILKAARDGYSNGFVEFWVARETLTRLSRIYLFSVPPNCQ